MLEVASIIKGSQQTELGEEFTAGAYPTDAKVREKAKQKELKEKGLEPIKEEKHKTN